MDIKVGILKRTYFLLFFFLFASLTIFGQKVLKTESGQRILLIDNGSWRLLSGLESTSEGDVEDGTYLESFKSPKQGKYPVNTDQREEIKRALKNLLSDEAQILVNMEMAKRELTQLKSEKDKAGMDARKNIESQIRETEKALLQDDEIYRATSALIFMANDLLDGKIKNHEKAIVSLNTEMNNLITGNTGMGGVDLGVTQSEEPVETKKTAPVIKYSTTFSVDDRYENKDYYDCEIIFDGYDEAIGEQRKEVKTQPFFSYSQEKMKPYFKNEDFLTCDANVSKVGKHHYLTLKIRIRSKDASKTYGTLFANENVKLQLINGFKFYGQIINTDRGKIESYTGHTLYTAIIKLNKSDIGDLKKTYLDNIGLIWSSGYEEYNIYNVDFLTNQFKCLNQ